MPIDPERHFAKKVARLQHEQGMTDEDLASRARLDPDELGKVLQGKEVVQLDMIYLLAGALGVEPRVLLDGLAWTPDGRGGGGYRAEE